MPTLADVEDGGMSDNRFYGELARWWPLISPPEEYAEEAAYIGSLLHAHDRPVHTVLELGSGGGHNAVHLLPSFDLTLTDLSTNMLEVSAVLNPGTEHLVGDMRDLRLGRRFDAVLLHDAVDYMCTSEDLSAALATAYEHLAPGGLAIVLPDATAETFEPSTDHGGVDASDGRGARYLAWTWDPDPEDTWIYTDYSFLLREADGNLSAVNERHRTGLFSQDSWLALLAAAGLAAHTVVEETTEEREPRVVFLGVRAGD